MMKGTRRKGVMMMMIEHDKSGNNGGNKTRNEINYLSQTRHNYRELKRSNKELIG